MRVKTYAVGMAAAFGAAVAWFAGCGGSIDQVTGSATGAGTGGVSTASTGTATATATSVATTSSGTTTTGTTTSNPTTTSSGAGGGSPCDMACAHLDQCGLGVTCATLNINCATLGTQYDCELECLDGIPCSQLESQGMACFTAKCGDGGTGPADGGTGPTDAGTSPTDAGTTQVACGGCLAKSCAGPVLACYQDTTCKGWLTCTGACNMANPPSVSCSQACDAQYPGASALYTSVYTCTCASCGTECASTDPCGHGTDGGP